MGLLDKAKNFASGLSDETVRKGDFNEEEQESSKRTSKSKDKSKRVKKTPSLKRANTSASEDNFINEYIDDEVVAEESESTQKIKDILKSMNIEETFEIPSDILFVDEELSSVEFPQTGPYGYDFGSVDFFVGRTQKSIAEYVKLLRIRNEDIANLASAVQKLIVTNNNLKFNAEATNGINIMTGGGDEDALEVEAMELRLKVKKLSDENERLKHQGSEVNPDNGNEAKIVSELRNQISILSREKEQVRQENEDLRSKLAYMEEDMDMINSDEEDLHFLSNDDDSQFTMDDNTRGRAEENLYKQDYDEPEGIGGILGDTSKYVDEVEFSLELEDENNDDMLEEELSLNEASEHENLGKFEEDYDDEDGEYDEYNNWIVNGEVRGFVDDDGLFRRGYYDENDEWVETSVEEFEDEEEQSDASILSDDLVEQSQAMPESSLIEYDEDDDEMALNFTFDDDEPVDPNKTFSLNTTYDENSAFSDNPLQNIDEFIDENKGLFPAGDNGTFDESELDFDDDSQWK